MKSKIKLIGIIFIFSFVLVNVAQAALPALVVCGRSGHADCQVRELFKEAINLVNYLIGGASLVAIGYVFYGGVYMILARGKEDQYKYARQTMTNAISGLIIILLAYLIVNFIVSALTGASFSDIIKFAP